MFLFVYFVNPQKKKSQKKVWKERKIWEKLSRTEPMHSRLQKSPHYLTTKASYLLYVASYCVQCGFLVGLLCTHNWTVVYCEIHHSNWPIRLQNSEWVYNNIHLLHNTGPVKCPLCVVRNLVFNLFYYTYSEFLLRKAKEFMKKFRKKNCLQNSLLPSLATFACGFYCNYFAIQIMHVQRNIP